MSSSPTWAIQGVPGHQGLQQDPASGGLKTDWESDVPQGS